jgi:hypothetical protein
MIAIFSFTQGHGGVTDISRFINSSNANFPFNLTFSAITLLGRVYVVLAIQFFGKKNYLLKTKIIYNFEIFVATNNGRTKKLSSSSFCAAVGSGIRIMIRNKHPGFATLLRSFVMFIDCLQNFIIIIIISKGERTPTTAYAAGEAVRHAETRRVPNCLNTILSELLYLLS